MRRLDGDMLLLLWWWWMVMVVCAGHRALRVSRPRARGLIVVRVTLARAHERRRRAAALAFARV